MWGFIIFFLYLEIYSAAVAINAKNSGMRNYLLCLIPFVACFFVDKITDGFKMFSIKVQKWGLMTVQLFVVALAAYLFAMWGTSHLRAESVMPLIQIMLVPISFAVIIFYVGTVCSALRILFVQKTQFRLAWLVCMLFITIPFVLAFSRRYNSKVSAYK